MTVGSERSGGRLFRMFEGFWGGRGARRGGSVTCTEDLDGASFLVDPLTSSSGIAELNGFRYE